MDLLGVDWFLGLLLLEVGGGFLGGIRFKELKAELRVFNPSSWGLADFGTAPGVVLRGIGLMASLSMRLLARERVFFFIGGHDPRCEELKVIK